MGAFEELLESWRSNPTADSTLALCSHLSQQPREELAREVGARSEQWHSADSAVMLAVGRMYLDGGLLAESQAAMVLAGKADPRDARPFRYLGEVLLRRGDATRAEKVLARAIQLGSNDSDTQLWHDRAVVYVALQKRVGAQAVAAEVARTLPQSRPAAAAPKPARPPAPQIKPKWSGEEPPTIPKVDMGPLAPGVRPPSTAPPKPKPRSAPPPLPSARIAQPKLPPRSPPPTFGSAAPALAPAAPRQARATSAARAGARTSDGGGGRRRRDSRPAAPSPVHFGAPQTGPSGGAGSGSSGARNSTRAPSGGGRGYRA